MNKNVKTVAWANGNNYTIIKSTRDSKEYNVRRLEYDVFWSEPFEIDNFPFDVQDLSFVFQSPYMGNKVGIREFVPSRVFSDMFRIETSFVAVADWELVYCDVFLEKVDWVKILSDNKDSNPLRTVSRISFRIQVKRSSKPIMVRVIFWLFLLGVLSFGAFRYVCAWPAIYYPRMHDIACGLGVASFCL